jgi:YVTN family beta-propeller protein
LKDEHASLVTHEQSVGLASPEPRNHKWLVGVISAFGLAVLMVVGLVQALAAPAVVTTVLVGFSPRGVAVNSNTGYVYTSNELSNTVSVISSTTNTVVATVTVGSLPFGIAVNPNTNRIYVTNRNSGNVSVINGNTNTVISTIAVNSNPLGVAINPNTNRIYVANFNSSTISVISGTNNTVLTTIPVGTNPMGIALNSNTGFLYVANAASDNVSVISTTNNSIVSTIPVGDNPRGVALNPNTGYVYVSNAFSNNVTVIDGTNNTVVTTTNVGTTPIGVTVNPNNNLIYVANSQSDNISVMDGATNSVVATTTVGVFPYGLGVNLNTGYIYVGNRDTNNVSVLSPGPITTNVSLSSQPNPSTFGKPVTFTATLSPTIALGTVAFTFDNAQTVTTTVSNGVATYVTNTLSVGEHTVVANYTSSSPFYINSTSATLTHVVNPLEVIAFGGNGQTALINTQFQLPMLALIRDADSNPLDGRVVTFTAPTSGASATFNNGTNVYTVTSSGGGLAFSSVFTANAIGGTYNISVTTAGLIAPVVFTATNCDPVIVTLTGDGNQCGTLRYAVAAASNTPTKTVTLNLSTGSVISLSSELTLTGGLTLITTLPCGTNPPIIIDSNGAKITLTDNSNSLYGLWLRNSQLVIQSGGNKLNCVRVSRT